MIAHEAHLPEVVLLRTTQRVSGNDETEKKDGRQQNGLALLAPSLAVGVQVLERHDVQLLRAEDLGQLQGELLGEGGGLFGLPWRVRRRGRQLVAVASSAAAVAAYPGGGGRLLQATHHKPEEFPGD